MLQNCTIILVLFLKVFTVCSSHHNPFSQIPYFFRKLGNVFDVHGSVHIGNIYVQFKSN
jgi:hypothetical protein